MGMWGWVANHMSVRLERPESPCEHADRRSEMIRRPIRANFWGEVRDTLSPLIMAWHTAVCVVSGLSSANMLPRARPICMQKLLGNPKCPRRADNLLSYISFQTSKNDFARQCDRSILRILAVFRVGQRGRRSDVSSFTLRSPVLNHQTLCPIVHSRHCVCCFVLLNQQWGITSQRVANSKGDALP